MWQNSAAGSAAQLKMLLTEAMASLQMLFYLPVWNILRWIPMLTRFGSSLCSQTMRMAVFAAL
jgi:hypothetical protein